MTRHTFHWSSVRLMGMGIALCIGTGCTHTIDMTPSLTDSHPTVTHTVPTTERVPLVMDAFQLSRNGAPQNPSTETERRILNRIHDTQLFSTLIHLGTPSEMLSGKLVSARITVEETIDPHSWLSAFKGIVIGGSMFLLSPFIDFEYDYVAKVRLELERWDGQVNQYEGTASGTVQYKLFGATPVMIDELKGHVTEASLTDLTKQLVHDTTLYMASSAPLPASGIRMVTVKNKRPSATQPTQTIVPVATPTTP